MGENFAEILLSLLSVLLRFTVVEIVLLWLLFYFCSGCFTFVVAFNIQFTQIEILMLLLQKRFVVVANM